MKILERSPRFVFRGQDRKLQFQHQIPEPSEFDERAVNYFMSGLRLGEQPSTPLSIVMMHDFSIMDLVPKRAMMRWLKTQFGGPPFPKFIDMRSSRRWIEARRSLLRWMED